MRSRFERSRFERLLRASRRQLTLRRMMTIGGLTFAWCALWGSFSAANVLSGVAISLLALLVGVGGSGRGGIRPGPLLHFAALVGIDMVASTVAVIREVLTPTDYTEEGVIAVPVPIECKNHLLLVYVAITVTPGTAVVAAESDASVLYVHVLHSDRRDAVAAHIVRLAELANRALPTPNDPATEGPMPRSRASDRRAPLPQTEEPS